MANESVIKLFEGKQGRIVGRTGRKVLFFGCRYSTSVNVKC